MEFINTNMFYILTIGAYLVGSIPIGLIYAKLTGGTDPRTIGSGNIGATNMKRAGGKLAGIITLIGDIGKGSLTAIVATKYLTDTNEISVVCLAVFVGHLFSVFLKFRGGKGVATAIGVFVVLAPIAGFLGVLAFGIILFLGRYVSMASVISAIAMPTFLALLPWYRSYVVIGIIIAIAIFFKHWNNFQKITEKTEPTIDD